MKSEDQLIKKAEQAVRSKKEKVESDYYRLNYHIMPLIESNSIFSFFNFKL
jgi:beta-fructofuranosidase